MYVCLSLLEIQFVLDNRRRFHKQRPDLTAAGKLENVASQINSTRNCIGRGIGVFFLALSWVIAIAQVSSTPVSAPSPANHIKPYRVLLVVEHRSDPYGMVVRSEVCCIFCSLFNSSRESHYHKFRDRESDNLVLSP